MPEKLRREKCRLELEVGLRLGRTVASGAPAHDDLAALLLSGFGSLVGVEPLRPFLKQR